VALTIHVPDNTAFSGESARPHDSPRIGNAEQPFELGRVILGGIHGLGDGARERLVLSRIPNDRQGVPHAADLNTNLESRSTTLVAFTITGCLHSPRREGESRASDDDVVDLDDRAALVGVRALVLWCVGVIHALEVVPESGSGDRELACRRDGDGLVAALVR
jgi:hypothetical protein